MTDARSEILARLRKSPQKSPVKMPKPPTPVIDYKDPVAEFIRCAEASKATVSTHKAGENIPAMVAAYLTSVGEPLVLKYSDPDLQAQDWGALQTSEYASCDGSEKVALASAVSGISETGTVVSHSDKNLSTATLFLPEISLFLLDARDIVSTQEAFWGQQKERNTPTPRTYNFVTGPSRTGDIEQTIQMGAHGPYKVHIFLLNHDI